MLYFGVLKDVMGLGRAEMDLTEGTSVGELLVSLRESGVAAGSVWDSIAVAVNQEYARAGDVLEDGDEVALLPPVSGGCEAGMGRRAPGAKAPFFGGVVRGQG
ncbi:MAG: MoaD/ThiS family protein [Edaphobacter sp.]